MENRSVIVGKRRDTGKLEFLSDPNEQIAETEAKFMPFRLTRTHAEYEWTALCSLSVDRREWFMPPAVTPSETPKKAKSK